jgi:hypothetical protein
MGGREKGNDKQFILELKQRERDDSIIARDISVRRRLPRDILRAHSRVPEGLRIRVGSSAHAMDSRPWMLDPTPFLSSPLLRRPSGLSLPPPGAGYFASGSVPHRKLGSAKHQRARRPRKRRPCRRQNGGAQPAARKHWRWLSV